METIEISDLDEKTKFAVRLEIALRNNAIRIRELNKNGERFMQYIEDRESKIRNLLKIEGKFTITDSGKTVFP